MFKFFVVVFIVSAVYYSFQEYHLSRYFNAIGGEVIYGQAEINTMVGGRDVHFVFINERFRDEESCDNKIIKKYITKMCEGSLNCSSKRYQCTNTIKNKYANMFNKNAAATKYLHLFDEETGLKSIMLYWGLTSKEAEDGCKRLKQIIDSNKKLFTKSRCI